MYACCRIGANQKPQKARLNIFTRDFYCFRLMIIKKIKKIIREEVIFSSFHLSMELELCKAKGCV